MEFIPWNLRSDLPCLYGVFRFCKDSLDWFDESRWKKVIFPVGKIPVECLSQAKKQLVLNLLIVFKAWVPDEIYSWEKPPYCLELCQFDDLSENDKLEALERTEHHYLEKFVKETLYIVENLDEYNTKKRRKFESVSIENLPPPTVVSLQSENSTPLSVERVPMVASEVKSKVVDVDVSTGISASRKDVLRQTKEIIQHIDEAKKEIIDTVKDSLQGKIDTLDKIPSLDKTSGRWLKVSDYAKKVNVSTTTLRNERSKVHTEKTRGIKNHTGKSKGIENSDGTAGIHGKHVWRKDGTDDNGNPQYWYYLQRSF